MRSAHRIALFHLMLLLSGMPDPSPAASFTYRGELQDGGIPVTGTYQLRLTLYAGPSGNQPLAAAVVLDAVSVRDGMFAAALDFPDLASSVASGWLDVEVRSADDGSWWPLGQRAEVSLGSGTLCPASWALAGNALTDPQLQFLGTTDATAFEIRTHNSRHLRLTPSTNLIGGEPVTSNVVLGSRGNTVANSAIGASIGGGGALEGFSPPNLGAGTPNVVGASFATVGGGLSNRAGPAESGAGGEAATVAGGFGNVAAQLGATIGGGTQNQAVGETAVVGGGRFNFADGLSSSVLGGRENGAIGSEAAVGGGRSNLASGNQSTVSGGIGNVAPGAAASIPGGSSNCAGGSASWAGGTSATVRPAVVDNFNGQGGCFLEPASGDADGDEGSFVWADRRFSRFRSNGPNQFLVRSAGGVMLQKQTTQSQPRAFFNAVMAPSGLAVATALPASAVASFENSTDAFLHVLAPDSANKGLLFSGPGQLADGGILYDGISDSLVFLTNGGAPRLVLGASGALTLPTLGAAGSTSLCRNASNQIATCSSSRRYKDAIVDLDLGLDAVLALRPVAYRWTMDGLPDIGFVAEEVAAIDERLVTRNAEGQIEGVKYDRLSAVLANAVLTISADQQAQEEALQSLRDRQAHLETMVARLQAQHKVLVESRDAAP